MKITLSSRAKKIVPASRDDAESRDLLVGVKSLSVSASIVVCASFALANTVVEGHPYLPSSPNPCIAVESHGRRVSHLHVKFYRTGMDMGDSPYRVSSTNRDGKVCPSKLPDGKYQILVESGRRNAELDLDVGRDNRVSRFKMVLRLPDQLETAAQAPVAIWAKQFRGIVQDANGGVIPSVKIEILRRELTGEIDESPVANVQSNERGQFDCSLRSGTYVAIFEYRGFNMVVFPLEIDTKGWAGLKITMQIANMNRSPAGISELASEE